MKSKINVYQQKENPVHRWNVYNTFSESKDKYDLYFKNRFTVKNAWEKYDGLVPLSTDYVLYKLFDKGVGAQNSIWTTGKPDLVNYNIYTQGYNDIAANNFPDDTLKYKVLDWTTDGYSVSVSGLPQQGTVVYNSIQSSGYDSTIRDFIINANDGTNDYYQLIYREVFSGTGGIKRMRSVYPASLQSPSNTPNYFTEPLYWIHYESEAQELYNVRTMYNQDHLADSFYNSTELSLYIKLSLNNNEPNWTDENHQVFVQIRRNLNVNEFCVPNACDSTGGNGLVGWGFYRVPSNYYYENNVLGIHYYANWEGLNDLFITHQSSPRHENIVALPEFSLVAGILQNNMPFNLYIPPNYQTGLPSTRNYYLSLTNPTDQTDMAITAGNTDNLNKEWNDPLPITSLNIRAGSPTTINWYQILWAQSLNISITRKTKNYSGNIVYTNTYNSNSDITTFEKIGGYWIMGGIDCNSNPDYISYITITGATPTSIKPLLTKRMIGNYDLDVDGYHTYNNIKYSWIPFNEVYTEIDTTGGVFYEAIMKWCDYTNDAWNEISDPRYCEAYLSWNYGFNLEIEKSSIIWPSPLTDENYNDYIKVDDRGEDTMLFYRIKNYNIKISYNPNTQEPEAYAEMVVYNKSGSNNNTYLIKGKIASTGTLYLFWSETFHMDISDVRYYFDTNVQKYANGLIEAHTGTYPYNTSPYRAIVNGKLNLAWERDDYNGFNNGYAIYEENRTDTVQDFEEIINGYVNTDILDFEGFSGYNNINMETVRYGFSYPTEIYFPYRTIYDWEVSYPNLKGFRAVINYTQLQNLFDNWYENSIWRPNYVYQLTFPPDTDPHSEERIATYAVEAPTHTQYNWHPMGIKPYRYWLKGSNNTVSLQKSYIEGSEDNYLYEIIFELAEPIAANTFYLLDTERIKTNLIAPYAEPDPNEIYEVNETYQVVKPANRVKEWKYTTLTEYNNSNEERWLTQVVYQFPSGMYVPTQHWPQMLYENKRYDDVELVSSDDMDYPELGYYPPKEEMLPDNFKTEIEEGQAIYRYIGNINEYYSTVKAGSIYLPSGTDIEEELLLTPYDEKCENYNIETNPYGYEYIGEEEVVNKNALTSVATSTDFGAYPKDGVYNDNYWYEYIGTNEEVEYIWTENELRSNAIFNIDINSNQDFTIGDVAGASFTVDIQGNIRDTILYLGRKCKLYYDFENKDDYKDFGLFTIDDVKFMNHQVSTITAYDNIKKFDAPVYEYLTSDNVKPLYPMTAKTLFQLMCEYCEVPYYTSMDFLNSDKLCYGPFGDANLTARQVLSYVAELAAGYIVCDTNGFAVIKTMKPYINLINRNSLIIISNLYTTDYENIIPLLNSANIRKAEINRTYYSVRRQVNQKMDIFPTEIIDSIVFNNADTESFINYRKELNAIYDLSDNPFLAFVDNQIDADEITNGILDQIAILIPPIYDGDPKFYSGEIELKNFDYSTFGTKQIVRLLDEIKGEDFFIPTTISINEAGITLTAKGQPKYSTKIVNSELAKQVNSLKMNIKEIKLTIPDALADTLDNHGQQISTIETDLGAVQEDLGAVQESVSSLDTALETQRTQTSTQFTNVNRRDDGQDDRLDGHDTDIAAIQQKNTTQDAAIGSNTSAISTLTTTVGGLPTKTYVDNLNQVNSITNGWKLSIGEDEVSFYTDNGYLFISDGTTTWKLKLEVNA